MAVRIAEEIERYANTPQYLRYVHIVHLITRMNVEGTVRSLILETVQTFARMG